MPITIERYQSILEIAELAIQNLDLAHESLEHAKESVVHLKRELSDAANYPQDLAFDIENSVDRVLKLRISQQSRDHIIAEKIKIQINEKKNRNQKWKKRWQRDGTLPPPTPRIKDDPDEQLKQEWAKLDALQKAKIMDEPEPEPRLPQTGTDKDTYDPPSLPSRKKQVEAE